MDKRPCYRSLGGGRSSFSKSQQSYSHLGPQRETATCSFCFYSPKDWFLWSSQSENRSVVDPRSLSLQCRNPSSLSLLSASIYSRAHSTNFRQCQLSQSSRLKTFLQQVSESTRASFLTPIFTRTQPYRTSLENYTSKGNTQSLLSKYRSSQRSPYKSICSMGAS